jgi:type IV pilus assembly protein PilQ
MTKSLPLARAFDIFNDISKKYLNKIIIDTESRNMPIGMNIDNMFWLDAFELILKSNNLWYEEFDSYLQVIPISDALQQASEGDEKEIPGAVGFFTREVIISAILFEANSSQLRQMGMSWDIFYGKDVNALVRMTAADGKSGLFQVDIDPNVDFADIAATFKALENDNIGEVLASPQVAVRSGEQGRIQVGSDIAVTLRDFAGNAITQFFSTGIIIEAVPQVLLEDSVSFIYLDLQIERSNTTGTGENLEIRKVVAETEILLLDGEQTLIGGLYTTEESTVREGVPILKDLPWWFFGLKYLFGYESVSKSKRELLILLKAELLPSLEDRYQAKLRAARTRSVLEDERRKMRLQMQIDSRDLKKGK